MSSIPEQIIELVIHQDLPLRASMVLLTYDKDGLRIIFKDYDRIDDTIGIVIEFNYILAVQDTDESERTKIKYKRDKIGTFFEVKNSDYLRYFCTMSSCFFYKIEDIKHYLFLAASGDVIDILTVREPKIYKIILD